MTPTEWDLPRVVYSFGWELGLAINPSCHHQIELQRGELGGDGRDNAALKLNKANFPTSF